MDYKKADERDIENVLKILDNFSRTETSRMKIEVSEEVGISQAQVSRLEKNAISTLKKNIN